jgi:predicted glycosyltransferase
VLGLRDILDDPAVTTRRWRKQRAYRTIEELYDSVLIYGAQEIHDTGSLYGLNRDWSVDVHHCGYVCAESVDVERNQTRGQLGLGSGPLLVITAGGGADGHPMMKLCLDALGRLDGRSDLEVVCIAGPLMGRNQIRNLRALSARLPVRVLWCVEHAAAYFAQADLIVSMGGYNTLMEAIQLGKRILVLPRLGPSAEQRTRAEILSELGLVRAVPEANRTPAAVARVILESLEAEPPATELPSMNGLDTVVERLKDLLAARESRLRSYKGASSG